MLPRVLIEFLSLDNCQKQTKLKVADVLLTNSYVLCNLSPGAVWPASPHLMNVVLCLQGYVFGMHKHTFPDELAIALSGTNDRQVAWYGS